MDKQEERELKIAWIEYRVLRLERGQTRLYWLLLGLVGLEVLVQVVGLSIWLMMN